jgi:hypothetical protein
MCVDVCVDVCVCVAESYTAPMHRYENSHTDTPATRRERRVHRMHTERERETHSRCIDQSIDASQTGVHTSIS